MGGVIAFEMAQQLQAAGREVALLAIFDSNCPGLIGDWRRRRDKVFRAMRRLRKPIRRIGSYPKLFLRNPTTRRWFISEKIVGGDWPVLNSNSAASRAYNPSPYPGKITFFWASDRPKGFSDSRWGWPGLANGGIEIHRIPGAHSSIIFKEPGLQVLAERLKDCLDQALPSKP